MEFPLERAQERVVRAATHGPWHMLNGYEWSQWIGSHPDLIDLDANMMSLYPEQDDPK